MQTNITGQKFLVTGCAGFIGSFVTEVLLSQGAYVYGIDNLNTGSLNNIRHLFDNRNFEFIKADFCNKRVLENYINKVDYIYHAAVRGIGLSTANPLLELEVNIKGTLLLLELMRKSQVKRLVYASSASVYGDIKHLPEKETDSTCPLSPYGVSKLAAERYVIAYHHLYNLPVVALRYFNVYGPRQRKDSHYGGVISIFIHNALTNTPLCVYGDGNQTRDFTYIDDVVKVTIKSFLAKNALGKVINISGGKEYKITYLAKKIKEISSTNSAILHKEKRLIDNVTRRFGDISLAKQLLNYSPNIPLDKGIIKTIAWHRENLI